MSAASSSLYAAAAAAAAASNPNYGLYAAAAAAGHHGHPHHVHPHHHHHHQAYVQQNSYQCFGAFDFNNPYYTSPNLIHEQFKLTRKFILELIPEKLIARFVRN